MSKLEKLIAHLRSGPSEASFDDVKKVLEGIGFIERRTSSSHHIFKDSNGRMITIPTKSGRKVKEVYLHKILSLIDEEHHDSN